MKKIVLLAALTATTAAFAARLTGHAGPAPARPLGETHCGNGYTKEAAATAAERRAKEAAEKKQTCYEQVDMSKCTRESDGTWTCCTTSANHAGSCN